MTILKHSGGNISGIIPVQFAFQEDVLSLLVNAQTLTGTLVFKTGKSCNYLYATDETIQLEGKEEPTVSGMKYVYTLKMLVPKDRSEVELSLFQLNNRNLILSVTDKNGITRLLGNLVNPMKKISKLQKPAPVEGYNGWEVVFTGEFSQPAPYSVVVAPPNSTADPDES